MHLYDWLIVLNFILILVLPLPVDSFIINMITRMALIVVCCGLCALICGWPRRYKNDKLRKEILSMQPTEAVGYLSVPESILTGRRRPHYVSKGFTQQIGGDWNTYVHEDIEFRDETDGMQVRLELADADGNRTGETVTLRTLPPAFDNIQETIPYVSRLASVRYVASPYGANYYLSSVEIKRVNSSRPAF